jgi:hypothetical protein
LGELRQLCGREVDVPAWQLPRQFDSACCVVDDHLTRFRIVEELGEDSYGSSDDGC